LYYGYQDVANLLVEHGATLDIFTASALGMVDRVREFLDEAASPPWAHATGPKERHSAFGGYGVTPLHCAARGGSVEAAALLIERGLSVLAKDSRGDTPLHWAAAQGQLDTVRHLVQKGADVNATNLFGGTPLLVVARGKVAPRVVNLLVQSGAKVNATDMSGENALHKLAWFAYPKENLKAAQMLLDAGADANAKNHDGKMPLDILLGNKFRNPELVKLYRNYVKKGR
jgi:ankyrin repeat protein